MKRILIGLGVVAAVLILGAVWFSSSMMAHGKYHQCQWHREALDMARYWYALDNGMTNAPALVKAELAPYVQDEKAFTCPSGGIYSINSTNLHVGCSIPEHMFDSCKGSQTPPDETRNWLQDYPLDYRNSDIWWYGMDSAKDGTMLRMSGATVIFRGVYGQGQGWGTMEVAGSGTSHGSAGFGDKVLTTAYANGIYTMTFAGHVLRLTDHGRSLEIDKSTFDLSRNRPRISVDTNGVTQVEATVGAVNKPVQ
jgi:hypothetical protein